MNNVNKSFEPIVGKIVTQTDGNESYDVILLKNKGDNNWSWQRIIDDYCINGRIETGIGNFSKSIRTKLATRNFEKIRIRLNNDEVFNALYNSDDVAESYPIIYESDDEICIAQIFEIHEKGGIFLHIWSKRSDFDISEIE